DIHVILMTPMLVHLEPGWSVGTHRDGTTRIHALNKPVRLAELISVLDEMASGTPRPRAGQSLSRSVARRFEGEALLVEDNPVNQAVAQRLLERMGLLVQVAENGREAVAATQNKHFDIVFMDVQMPVMDGFEATRLIRSQESGAAPRVPVIALTANAMTQDREQCRAAGMDDFLAKPFSGDQLHSVLQRWLGGVGPAGSPGGSMQREALDAGGNAGAVKRLPETLPEDIPILESNTLQRLNELAGDDTPDLVATIIQLYLDDAPKRLAAINDAWQSRDAKVLATSAHALKSASANMGALRLAKLCKTLEADARANDLSRSDEIVSSLAGEWAAVKQALERSLTELPA
ncbi:MAG: response regulator, partial [Rhodocyclaceae bacterium]